ncbi:MAG: Hsp33 family molecular chaperone HslO [Pseudomonadota bacterium]
MADKLQPFYFDALPVRGAIVRLSSSLDALLDGRGYPEPIRYLLGESAAAACLIANSMKYPGRLTLQISSGGPLRMLAMQCRDTLDLRGMALLADAEDTDWDQFNFAGLTQSARCSVTIASNNVRERYQGIVEVSGTSLAVSLDNFFARSIQVPTRFWLQSDGREAVGVVLQTVAGHDDFVASDDWHRLGLVTDTLSLAEAVHVGRIGMVRRLYAEDDLRLPDSRNVRFHCDCSRDRASNAIARLGEDDANNAVAEQGELTVTCEYCGTERRFSPVDVAAIFSTLPISSKTH